MAQFAPWAGFLAVQVHVAAAGEQLGERRVLADEVLHEGAAARAVEPRGSPSTARMWFSNWLVSAPSIVQWPELWTRGANSLASTPVGRLEELEAEHADVAERVGDRAARSAWQVVCSAGSTPGAGAAVVERMPSTCTFSTSG